MLLLEENVAYVDIGADGSNGDTAVSFFVGPERNATRCTKYYYNSQGYIVIK